MYEEFINEMYKVFENTPKPSKDDMTPHRCIECDEIRDQLFKFEQRELPDKILSSHSDSLPLLSPEALRYYLPRYIEFSLKDQYSDVFEFILYHLAPEKIDDYWKPRLDIFTKEEKEIIVKYLEIRKHLEEAEYEEEWINRGLEVWV